MTLAFLVTVFQVHKGFSRSLLLDASFTNKLWISHKFLDFLKICTDALCVVNSFLKSALSVGI
jgi:hypothetical protein